MESIEKEVNLGIKYFVALRKKVKSFQDYSLGISSVQELGVGSHTILELVDNIKKTCTVLLYL